jgi:hypothetical protein
MLSDSSEKARVKACDFGLSQFFSPDRKFHSLVGSAFYVAPGRGGEQHGRPVAGKQRQAGRHAAAAAPGGAVAAGPAEPAGVVGRAGTPVCVGTGMRPAAGWTC